MKSSAFVLKQLIGSKINVIAGKTTFSNVTFYDFDLEAKLLFIQLKDNTVHQIYWPSLKGEFHVHFLEPQAPPEKQRGKPIPEVLPGPFTASSGGKHGSV